MVHAIATQFGGTWPESGPGRLAVAAFPGERRCPTVRAYFASRGQGFESP